jgi:hypothetical protein
MILTSIELSSLLVFNACIVSDTVDGKTELACNRHCPQARSLRSRNVSICHVSRRGFKVFTFPDKLGTRVHVLGTRREPVRRYAMTRPRFTHMKDGGCTLAGWHPAKAEQQKPPD